MDAQAIALAVALVAIALVAVADVTALEHDLSLALGVIILVAIALVILVQRALQIHALTAPRIPVQNVQQVLALLNRSLVANDATLAATKNVSPSSSPFCMESSRFR